LRVSKKIAASGYMCFRTTIIP